MSEFAPMSSTRKQSAAHTILAGLLCAGAAVGPTLGSEGASQREASVPNFSPSSRVGWLKTGRGDEFLPPDSGPGPVVSDPAHPYVPSGGFNPYLLNPRGDGRAETAKIADVTNPILKPWAAEQMRRANDEVLAGKVGFTARSRCWPHGVPGFLLYPVHPIFFIQSPKEVIMVWGQDFQLRRVYLNEPHSANPKPSWYGESVGHYENGDTFVVDTIGLNDKTYVDNYRTPHTTQLHVVERFRIVDNGKALEAKVHVEIPVHLQCHGRPFSVTGASRTAHSKKWSALRITRIISTKALFLSRTRTSRISKRRRPRRHESLPKLTRRTRRALPGKGYAPTSGPVGRWPAHPGRKQAAGNNSIAHYGEPTGREEARGCQFRLQIFRPTTCAIVSGCISRVVMRPIAQSGS